MCLIVLLLNGPSLVFGEAAGTLVEISTSADNAVSIPFRFCPSGKISPERPTADNPVSNSSVAVSLKEFYISQSEITLSQFRAVLGRQGLERSRKLAESQKALNPQLLDIIENGQNEPVFLIGLEEAADFCLRMRDKYESDVQKTTGRTIEARRFRLPSHVEWQYAGRGVTTIEDQAKKPHFYQWIDKSRLSVNNQEKCKELWKSIGQKGEFPGDQASFLSLSDISGPDNEKVKDILAEAFQRSFNSPERNASGIGKIYPVGRTQPNSWNITDIHEGVCEWALWSMNQPKAIQQWENIEAKRKDNKSLENLNEIYLCGGSFDTYYTPGSLSRFTVWGGPKMSGQAPAPFNYGGDNMVLDYTPGFRILMERSISVDWLNVLRSGVYAGRDVAPNSKLFIEKNLQIHQELSGPQTVLETLEFYQDVVSGACANPKVMLKHIERASIANNDSVTSGANTDSKKKALGSFLGNNKKEDSNTKKEVSTNDETEYFLALKKMIETPAP